MNIINDIQLDFSDVLIQPKRSNLTSRKEVDLYRTFVRKWEEYPYSFNCIPVCAANMGTVGTPKVARELVKHGMMCALEKHISNDDILLLYDNIISDWNKEGMCPFHRIAISTGVNEPLDSLIELNHKLACMEYNHYVHGINIINIDVANGYQTRLVDRVKEVREKFPGAWIIAGNVVTPDIVYDLIQNGASIAKVGIGSGSVCLTRLKTGVGRPQLSTIMECADAAHQVHGYIMSDGGCNCVGDICKAFCGGADFVMSGSMFAGTDEADGDIVYDTVRKYKVYYGMSSNLAQQKHFGGIKDYRTSEGREVYIPYTGTIEEVVTDICGGLASCCTYIGSHCIKHMSKHTTFYRVNNQLNTKFANCQTI